MRRHHVGSLVAIERRDTERIPRRIAAVFRDGVHWATYVVDGGRARLRRVEVGHVGESAAQVLGGLEEGAVVISYPGDQIRDGVRVTTRD